MTHRSPLCFLEPHGNVISYLFVLGKNTWLSVALWSSPNEPYIVSVFSVSLAALVVLAREPFRLIHYFVSHFVPGGQCISYY